MILLFVVVCEGYCDVCEFLLEWDVDIDYVDKSGWMVLFVVVFMGYVKIVY